MSSPKLRSVGVTAEVADVGVLVLRELPFAAGERVAVTVASRSSFVEMRSYAERMAAQSAQFVQETAPHMTARLLRETEW